MTTPTIAGLALSATQITAIGHHALAAFAAWVRPATS